MILLKIKYIEIEILETKIQFINLNYNKLELFLSIFFKFKVMR